VGGSNIPPPALGKATGYFGKKGRGPYDANDALLKEYYAKNKGKARAKPKPKPSNHFPSGSS